MRSLLLAVIRFYRRRLSGRGPFAKVRCTFERLESCSAFAERVTRESSSAWIALRRIWRRLRRCRHLSLYRLPREKLGWGCDYDVVLTSAEGTRELDAALAADGEGEAVRAAVGRAAARVAVLTGKLPRGQEPAGGPFPLLRDAAGVRRACTRRLWVGLGAWAMFVALAVGAIVLEARAAGVALLLASLIPAVSALGSLRMLRRLRWLEVLAAIDGPPRLQE